VLATVLLPVAVTATWLDRTIVDTEQFIATVGPLSESAPIQEAIADAAVNAINTDGAVETRVDDLLPQALAPLAPAIAGGLTSFLREAIVAFIRSPVFESLWKEIILTVHTGLIAVLEGREGGAVGLANGEVTLDLNPILDRISKDLVDRGLTIFSQVKLSTDMPPIVLFKSDQLAFIQQVFALVQPLVLALMPLTIALYALAVVISRRRPVAATAVAVAYAIGVGAMWVGLSLFRAGYEGTLGGGIYGEALIAFANQILVQLQAAIDNNLVFALALFLVSVMALGGPMGRVRSSVEEAIRGMRGNRRAERAALGYERWNGRLAVLLVIAGTALTLANNMAWQWTVGSLIAGLGIMVVANLAVGSPTAAPGSTTPARR